MVEFFLGVIAVVLVIAFWEKVRPALEGTINAIVSVIAAPFKLFFIWIKGLMFTLKAFGLIIKHSWEKHKILFIIAVLSFFSILASGYTPHPSDVKWIWLIYFCGICGLLCSVVFSLSTINDLNKDIMKITSLQEVDNSEPLSGMIAGYSALFLYFLYYMFGIEFATNVYTALFFSFMVVSIIVWLKNRILKKK